MLQLAVDRGGRVPMVIGALLVLDPGNRPCLDDVRSLVLRRTAAVPRLGQRLVRTPVGAGRAVWLAAGADAVDACVDSVVVDSLGREGADEGAGEPRSNRGDGPAGGRPSRALVDALADLAHTRLPMDWPLWRARLLVAPDGGVAAVALVAHHVLADGMGGLAVLGALADGSVGDDRVGGGRAAPRVERGTSAELLPSWGALARDAWVGRLGRVAGHGAHRPRLTGGFDELGLRGPPRLAQRCSLLGATGDRRRVELATADLAGVHAAARAAGATVNDAVVTAVTGALVSLLVRRGEQVDELVVSMPVSRRAQGDSGALGNETGVVPVRVPAVPDGGRRLAALVEARARVRAPGRGGSAAVLTPAFRALAAVGAFQRFIDHQRLVHTFVTNVRGPAERLRIAGTEVTAVVPLALNPGNVAVSFDVLSYAGTLGVTLVCDPTLVPESAWLADRVAAELAAFCTT